MKTIAIVPVAALSLSLAAASAFAQEGSPTLAPAATPAEIAISLAPEGLLLGAKPAVTVKYVAVLPGDMPVSTLMGVPIYTVGDEKVGEISDLVLSEGDALTGVVASVGGFLGIGESYVVIDPSTIVLSQTDGEWVARVDTTKDALEAAPKFQYPAQKS